MKAARASLALRAATIAGIGLLLGQMEIPAFIILSYYGAMFALAIPLLGLGARALAACAAGFATVGALSSWALADALPNLGEYDPSLYFLVSDPGGTLSALLFTGAYPAIPWMAYVCAGLALGKLDLRSLDIQLRIFLTGLSLALGTALLSALLLGPLGGKDALLSSMRGRGNEAALQEALTWGPIESTPVGSGWWQVALSPYSNTVFELLNTLGVALAVFAAMLFISGRIAWAVAPLAQVGSMTLTLYTGHLLFLATGDLGGIAGILAVGAVWLPACSLPCCGKTSRASNAARWNMLLPWWLQARANGCWRHRSAKPSPGASPPIPVSGPNTGYSSS